MKYHEAKSPVKEFIDWTLGEAAELIKW